MMISFRVSNYASFKEVCELSMVAGKSTINKGNVSNINDLHLLRTSAIYGANASGKSNLIKAIEAMKKLVIKNEPICSDRYFRPESVMIDEPSLFEMELEVDGIAYSYGFEYLISEQKVMEEWLYRIFPDSESEQIFTRVGSVINGGNSENSKNTISVYAKDVSKKPQTLFINVMGSRARQSDEELDVFNDIYDWFSRKLIIMNSNYVYTLEAAVSDEDLKGLNRIISAFGTGVNSVAYEPRDIDESSLPPDLCERLHKDFKTGQDIATLRRNQPYSVSNYRASMVDDRVVLDEIMYRHNGDTVSFRPEEESDGTRKLCNLVERIFLGEDGSTFIIDELDASFHPQLTYRFVKLFIDCKERNKTQVIFTTHESSLMDFNLLRRDQIWFIEKSFKGNSELYSLEEFNERNDRRIDKAYMEGRYGGVPVFSTIYPPGE